MSAAFLHQRDVPLQGQRPALRPVHGAGDRFPSGTVPVDVPGLKLDPRAGRGLGAEPNPALAGLLLIALNGPPRADIPAEHDPVRRVEGQDPRPPALAAVLSPV